MKKCLMLLLVVFLLLSGGCSDPVSQVSPEGNGGELLASFECSHGVSSINPIEDCLEFSGSPVEVGYTFKNGNIASNFGLLLFVDGRLQPFQIDNQDLVEIGIIELEAGEERTFVITFTPVIGRIGEVKHLHILALFDAANNIESPTIGPMFYHAMSQTIPIDIQINADVDLSQGGEKPESRVDGSLGLATLLGGENVESDMYTDFQKEGSCVLNSTGVLHIVNGEKIPIKFFLYALVDNQVIPVSVDGADNVTIAPCNEQTIEFVLSSDEDIFADANTLSFIAVPQYEETNDYSGTDAYKTRTISVKKGS